MSRELLASYLRLWLSARSALPIFTSLAISSSISCWPRLGRSCCCWWWKNDWGCKNCSEGGVCSEPGERSMGTSLGGEAKRSGNVVGVLEIFLTLAPTSKGAGLLANFSKYANVSSIPASKEQLRLLSFGLAFSGWGATGGIVLTAVLTAGSQAEVRESCDGLWGWGGRPWAADGPWQVTFSGAAGQGRTLPCGPWGGGTWFPFIGGTSGISKWMGLWRDVGGKKWAMSACRIRNREDWQQGLDGMSKPRLPFGGWGPE